MYRRRVFAKHKLCLALDAVILAGSLASCPGGTSRLPGDTPKASEAPAGREAEGTPGESAVREAGEKPYTGTTIHVFSMTGQVSDAIEAYLDDFERGAGIKVDLELYGGAQFREKITAKFLADSPTVDAFLMNPLQDMTAYSNNGRIGPLDEYLRSPNFDWDDSSLAPMEQIKAKSGGAVGALPSYSSAQLIFYRKDVFEEGGAKVPTNYNELLDVCGKISDPVNNSYTITCRGEKIALTSQSSPLLYGFGGTYFKDGACTFNTPENLEAARFYGKLLDDYAPEDIPTVGYSQTTQLFNAGRIGMCVNAIALYQTLIGPDESSFYDKVGVAPIPEGPAGRQSYKQVVWDVSIYPGLENKEAAWEFLKYAAGKDIAADITPEGMPTFRASAWEDERVTAAMPEDYIQAYNEGIQAGTISQYGLPRMIVVSEVRDTMGEAIVYSIETKGEGTGLESKTNAAARKVDQLLKDMGEHGADYSYRGQRMSESNGKGPVVRLLPNNRGGCIYEQFYQQTY